MFIFSKKTKYKHKKCGLTHFISYNSYFKEYCAHRSLKLQFCQLLLLQHYISAAATILGNISIDFSSFFSLILALLHQQTSINQMFIFSKKTKYQHKKCRLTHFISYNSYYKEYCALRSLKLQLCQLLLLQHYISAAATILGNITIDISSFFSLIQLQCINKHRLIKCLFSQRKQIINTKSLD